jgi:hypothetical protein
MAIRAYYDFILFSYDVEEDAHGQIRSFKVRVFDSPVGQGEDEDPPVTIDHYDRLVQWSRDLEDRQLDGNVEAQRKLGTCLGELLLPPRAREMFNQSYRWLKPDEGLRLRLRLEVKLADLPWEYVYLDSTADPSAVSGFIALNPRISIVRHEALALPAVALTPAGDRAEPAAAPETGPPALAAEWLQPPAPAKKRRIVIAMATPEPYPAYPPLELLPQEQIKIRQSLAGVKGIEVIYLPTYRSPDDYRVVSGATFPKLQSLLAPRTDIFHFSGHGEFKKALGPGGVTIQGEGTLILATEQNQADPVSAEEIRKLIGACAVRLVVLGACESARRDPLHKLSSVAVALLKGRIPCVVAMQFSVQDVLASAFVEAFYQALVAGLEIDEAVALGRAAVWNRTLGEGTLRRDWGVPVLYLRTPGGRIFPPVSNARARQEAEQRSQERFDLNAAWWDWMVRGDVASAAQLDRLAAAGERLQLSPVQVLLLLRSAVKQDVSPAPWLDRLHQVREATLAQLAEPGAATGGPAAEARKILGLDQPPAKPCPPGVDSLAWSAAWQKDAHTRQVAALAVTALKESRPEGLAALEGAVRSLGPWRAWRRRAELRGTLADADPEVERLNRKLLPWDRMGVWGWRVGRRVRRDGFALGRLLAGGAIGAGVGLGVLRLVLAILPAIAVPLSVLPGVQLGMYAYWGGILGFFLCLGVLLADPLLLRQLQLPGRKATPGPAWRRFLLAVGLGTLFTGLALLLESWLNGLQIRENPLVPPLGFLFGLGLSLALYGQPAAGRRMGLGRALLRLGAAVTGSVLTQLTFVLAGKGLGIAIAWPGSRYHAYLSSLVDSCWPGLAERVPRWADYLGLVDAALVGAVLAGGITLGTYVALRSLRLADSPLQAGEPEGGAP